MDIDLHNILVKWYGQSGMVWKDIEPKLWSLVPGNWKPGHSSDTLWGHLHRKMFPTMSTRLHEAYHIQYFKYATDSL